MMVSLCFMLNYLSETQDEIAFYETKTPVTQLQFFHQISVASSNPVVRARGSLFHVVIYYLELSSSQLVMLSEYILCFCFSFYVFHIGWTLTTKQLLKHLKIYFVLSFIVLHVTPLSSTISAGVTTLRVCVCACVCVCGVFVSLLYESCKMANIHMLYKVSFFSPTITFGFFSFFPHILHQWC